jgi:hypothetical protein
MNIVLLIIDTLRYDYVAANGRPYGRLTFTLRTWIGWWRSPELPARVRQLSHHSHAPTHDRRYGALPPLGADRDRPTSPGTVSLSTPRSDPRYAPPGQRRPRFRLPFHAWTPVRGRKTARSATTGLPPNRRLTSGSILPRDEGVRAPNAGAGHIRHRHRTREDWNARLYYGLRPPA